MEQLPTIEQMAENVELQFKQKVHEEVMERLKKFTFKENMMIAFTPVIIYTSNHHGIDLDVC